MPRKNSRVQRTKTPRRYRPTDTPQRPRNLAPIPIENTVVPKGKCYFRNRYGKLIFTQDQVDTALKHAQHNRTLSGSGKREQRYYKCDGGDHFHLTSRETWEPRP